MFWILGADSIGGAMAGLKAGPLTAALAEQLDHVAWEGFRFYDLIFPMFVFMIGVSLVFSLGRIQTTEGKAQAVQRIVKRSLLLYLLGIFVYNGSWKTWEDVRLLGVLQRLALCYFFTSLLFLLCRPKALLAVLIGILAGYWALLTWVPIPGHSVVSFAEGKNIVNWVDAHYLPWRKWDGDHDPEGLLSTLPAIGSCLLGVFAGLWLKPGQRNGTLKAMGLLGAGVALLVLGYGWGHYSPIIKKLWTSPYVLVAGGWSAILLGCFYFVIDVLGLQLWARPFVWVGMNPIALYLTAHVAHFDRIASSLVGGPVSAALDQLIPGLGAFVVSVSAILLCVALARLMYVKNLFIRL